MKRFFFVTGRTSDEFYTDGLLKLNIEQLIHIELKKVGYHRVVFFDKNNKLYTYDDESFELLSKNGDNASLGGGTRTPSIRRTGGLKNGKIGQVKKTVADSSKSTEGVAEIDETSEWIKGEKSGIAIKNIVSDRLHMGLKDDFFVSRTIEAYMDDKSIKTANDIKQSITSRLSASGMQQMVYNAVNSFAHSISGILWTSRSFQNHTKTSIISTVANKQLLSIMVFDKELVQILTSNHL